MKKSIITITGDLASGKSRITDKLQENLGYKIYRNGEYVRNLAKEMGMDITAFNGYLKEHPEIDEQIDKSAAQYAKENDDVIVDARLGFFAVPDSFKIYLKVDIDVGAKRAFYDVHRKSTENFETVEEQKQDMLNRDVMENERFFKLYNVKKNDMSNYDLVIDTTNKSIEEIVQILLEEYKKWLHS